MVRDSKTGQLRSVMYKGFSSELFVPYMDIDEAWYFKTYMDAGEFGLGAVVMSLVPLNDCPRNSHYMDGIFVASDGKPFAQPNIICLFERYAGDISWRHLESLILGLEVTLVARMSTSVGNYDYIFDWEFQTDGLIQIKVGLSRMPMVKGSLLENIYQVPNQDDLSGSLVSKNVIGVVHDHFITFRLDLDVDGANNSFIKVNLEKEGSLPSESPRKSYLKAKRQVAQTEKDAQIKLKLYDPSEFHIINPSRRSRLGNPAGYKVVPEGNAASLLNHDDPPQLRSSFTNNQIWVTLYNKSEQWAGGLLVYQSKGDDTLAIWNRPIENSGIVLWYTLGFHHIPCQEDFPIMPTVSSSFALKPINFFDSNSILRAAPAFETDLPDCNPSFSS
ncbi:hypothetical protein SLA2020_292030 [Shorea laevis]